VIERDIFTTACSRVNETRPPSGMLARFVP
jgi:hypothetical protein